MHIKESYERNDSSTDLFDDSIRARTDSRITFIECCQPWWETRHRRIYPLPSNVAITSFTNVPADLDHGYLVFW
jgi:hypothetical protein